MTLNASWIERLTLRGQVIRETKGQAKQKEDPQLLLTRPFPPESEEDGKLQPCSDPRSSACDSAEQDTPKLERNEASGWIWNGNINCDVGIWLLFSCGDLTDRTFPENWLQSCKWILRRLLRETDSHLVYLLMTWSLDLLGRWGRGKGELERR